METSLEEFGFSGILVDPHKLRAIKTRSRLLKTTAIWVFALLVLGFLAKTLFDLWDYMRFKPEARVEMRHLWSRVQLGNSQRQFERIFAAGNYRTLELRRVQTQKWLVRTPLEWGAGNWHLHVEWDAKNRIGALRIRTNDSIHQRPRDAAPADRIAPNWRRPFPKPW